VKLIALSYSVLAPNPISFFPINALAWTITVVLVYKITLKVLPDKKNIAVLSALLFGICPSYLLHTTQLLKEPFYVLGIIMMIRGWVGLMSGNRPVSLSIFVGLGILLAYLNRASMLIPLIGLSVLAFALVVWRGREAWACALLACVSVMGVYVFDHQRKPEFKNPRDVKITEMIATRIQDAGKQGTQRISDGLWHHFFRLAYSRDCFIHGYPNAGSNIEQTVRFKNPIDIVRYIPRGLQIGFLAPFPGHWLGKGKSAGGASRILAGMEMIGWYILLPGFVWFLFSGNAAPGIRVWLALYCISMVLLAALVVTNLGALMRIRFVYFLPIIIGGLEGWSRFIWRKKVFRLMGSEE